jgi:uncharacterized membrane protein YbhN (UPF0104 family)
VNSTLVQIRSRIGRRGFAAAGLLLLALLVAVATPQILGTRVARALDTVGSADPKWLWIAGLGFALSVLAAAGSWRCAIGLCGGRIGVMDACARYGAGSLVNTFVPARAGDAVRIGLFARALPNKDRLWTTGGAFAVVSAAKAVVLGALVVAGAATGVVPLWPLLISVGLVAAVVGIAVASRRREPGSRASHLLDVFRAIGLHPTGALRLTAWAFLSCAARLTAATAILASLGISHPLVAAIVIVAALDVASALPLTPGNFGITSGAVAMALQAHGLSFTEGLAAGIALHAVETAIGLMVGIASVVWLAPYPSPAARRVTMLAGTASWVLGIAGAFGATVLAPLV